MLCHRSLCRHRGACMTACLPAWVHACTHARICMHVAVRMPSPSRARTPFGALLFGSTALPWSEPYAAPPLLPLLLLPRSPPPPAGPPPPHPLSGSASAACWSAWHRCARQWEGGGGRRGRPPFLAHAVDVAVGPPPHPGFPLGGAVRSYCGVPVGMHACMVQLKQSTGQATAVCAGWCSARAPTPPPATARRAALHSCHPTPPHPTAPHPTTPACSTSAPIALSPCRMCCCARHHGAHPSPANRQVSDLFRDSRQQAAGTTAASAGADGAAGAAASSSSPRGPVIAQALCGDLNTLGNGVARLSANYCQDAMRCGAGGGAVRGAGQGGGRGGRGRG